MLLQHPHKGIRVNSIAYAIGSPLRSEHSGSLVWLMLAVILAPSTSYFRTAFNWVKENPVLVSALIIVSIFIFMTIKWRQSKFISFQPGEEIHVYRYGNWAKGIVIASSSRIKLTHIEQSLLGRLFKTRHLMLYTGGTKDADISLFHAPADEIYTKESGELVEV